MPLELAQIVGQLIETVAPRRETEGGEHRLMDLFRCPAADVGAGIAGGPPSPRIR